MNTKCLKGVIMKTSILCTNNIMEQESREDPKTYQWEKTYSLWDHGSPRRTLASCHSASPPYSRPSSCIRNKGADRYKKRGGNEIFRSK